MGSSHSSKVTNSKETSATTETSEDVNFDLAVQQKINNLANDSASFEEFSALSDEKKVEKAETFLRLTQSIIYHFNSSEAHFDQLGDIFSVFIDKLNISTDELAKECLPQLQPYFENSKETLTKEHHHLNACLFVYNVIGQRKLFARCEWKPIVEYLVGVVQKSNTDQLNTSVLWAVLALELATRQGLDGEQLNACLDGMKDKQSQLTEYFNNLKEADIYSVDPIKYQVAFLLANYMHVNFYPDPYGPGGCFAGGCIPPPANSSRLAICEPFPHTNYVPESPPAARVHYFPMARNDDWQLPTVRSSFSLSSAPTSGTNAFYYEAVLLTHGKRVAIGWATREAIFSESKGVGDDAYGVSITNKNILHGGNILKDHKTFFKAGDVIGCLIDLSKRSFSFYLNGEECVLKDKEVINFSAQPYFAAASLGPHEQVWFNFGQTPFKHAPNEVISFDAFCERDTNRYRLVAPEIFNQTDYCFKETLNWDGILEAMFVDDKQDQLDRLLVDLEVGVISEAEFGQLLTSLLGNDDQYASLRFFNSVLTEVGYRTSVDVNKSEEALEKLFAILNPHLKAYASQNTLPMTKTLELLLSYRESNFCFNDQFTYGNVSAVLLALLSTSKNIEELSKLFAEEFFYYFEDVLARGAKQLYKLFTVQCIHKLASEDAASRRKFRKQNRIVAQLRYNTTLARKSSASAQVKSSFDRLRVKLAVASQEALDAIFSNDEKHSKDDKKNTNSTVI